MNVLLTGAFGNIGAVVLAELVTRGHRVRCFDVPTRANIKTARGWERQVDVVWGDMRCAEEVRSAVQGQEAAVHLAYVIPTLSSTGVGSEERPDWAREINVGGTLNLLAALKSVDPAPRLLFASSLHVFGLTQHLPPPRKLSDPVQPLGHYALHKVACEEMVKSAGLKWAILRLGAAMPTRLILDKGMFDVPLNNRIEFVHSRDVAVAIANALEIEAAWGHTWLIGGGAACQLYYRDLVAQVMEAVGLGMLPENAFEVTPFSTDWLDTAASQQVLGFQRLTLDDYVQDVRRSLGPRRWFIRLLRPAIRPWLLRHSPSYSRQRHRPPNGQLQSVGGSAPLAG